MNTNVGNAVRIIPLAPEHADQIERLARALPAWFGIEAGLRDLRHCAESERGFVAVLDGSITGFITLSQPFPETREITWMAVAPIWHRHGIGRALINAVAADAHSSGTRLLHVKTLAGSHPSPEYAQTRAFYRAMGFERLVILPDLWDPENPCLLLVRVL